MIVKRQGDWLSAKVGEEIVMMSVANGRYIGLSEVAARVWELLETPRDFDGICAQLLKEFDVEPEICRSEVETFLRELVKQGAAATDPALAN